MIIKSMSRKTVSFGQLLRYINEPKEKGLWPVLHNLRASMDYLPQIEAEFLDNAKHIRNQRKDGVMLYHEIIAIAPEDRQHVTEAMLNDLAREYLRHRAPNALAYAKAQFNTASPHIHLLISGNLIESKQKLRLARGEFEQVKREIEAYQRQRYPMLTHSIVHDPQRRKTHDRLQETDGEHERARRMKMTGRADPTHKQEARERLKACLDNAGSEQHLIELLKAAQLAPYVRGKTPGVTDTKTGRKYRLNTLGLDCEGQETIKRLREQAPAREKTERRIEQLDEIELGKIQRQWLRLGFREEIAEVLRGDSVGRREREIGQAKQYQRELERGRGGDYGVGFPGFEWRKS